MTQRSAQREERELSLQEQRQIAIDRQRIAEELPDLVDRNRRARDARQEPTLSGELRRAIHNSDLALTEIANRTGMTPVALSEFLTGERTLRSDVLDRLAQALGYELKPAN